MSNTSNTIQIKRGISIPGDNNLAPYELGYVVKRYMNENDQLVDNNNGSSGYLYIGELKELDSNGKPVYESIPVKVKYASEAGVANGFSSTAQNLIKEIEVNSALGLGQDYTISAERNTLTWFQTHSSYVTVGATTENCIPTGYWWNIIRFNHWNASSLHYTDLAIPMNDIYTGLSYKQVIQGSVRDNSWINILDSYNYSNYALPITGGTIQLYNAATNEIKPGITLATHWDDTSSVNYGSSIKFMMYYPYEALRYSSIEGYANSQYANTTGLRFKVYDISKGYDEATFVGGVFTTPELVTKSIVSPTNGSLSIEATTLTALNFSAVIGIMTTLNVEGLAITNKMLLSSNLYGNRNPNTANISGAEGQLYFQVVS